MAGDFQHHIAGKDDKESEFKNWENEIIKITEIMEESYGQCRKYLRGSI